MNKTKDVLNQKFGRLIVIKRQPNKKNIAMWLCLCDCGNTITTRGTFLRNGTTKSCGCLAKESSIRVGKLTGGRNKLSLGRCNLNNYYQRYKRESIRRGYEFNLSINDFKIITEKNCCYCDNKPREIDYKVGAYGSYFGNGIDRIDNKIGYIISNCVPCCKRCNQAKNDMTKNEFFEWIKKVFYFNNF